MKITLDFKSAILGCLAGVLIMFTVAAGEPSPHPVGRFQMFSSSNPTQLFVIDTSTGQVWGASSTSSQLKNDPGCFNPKVQ